jgi:hypothetical protein
MENISQLKGNLKFSVYAHSFPSFYLIREFANWWTVPWISDAPQFFNKKKCEKCVSYVWSNMILLCCLCLGVQRDLFPGVFSPKLKCVSHFIMCTTCPHPSHCLGINQPKSNKQEVQIMKLLVEFPLTSC